MARHRSAAWLAGAALVAWLAPAALAEPGAAGRIRGTDRDRECLVCHAGIGPGAAPKLLLDPYRASAHGEIGCVSCHTDVEDGSAAHEDEDHDLARVRCAACHQAEERVHATSVHAQVKRGATCAQCHGGHDVFPAGDRRSSTSPFNLSAMCRECHDQERHTAGHTLEVPRGLRETQLPIDGDASARMIAEGVSLTLCTDCHHSHDIRRAADPASATHASALPATCGACHEQSAAELARSVHAQVGQSGRAHATCVSCHPVHDRAAYEAHEAMGGPGAIAVRECGRCHEPLMRTYAGSYHGKATLSGDTAVARCSDCHGYHDVRGAADPASSISAAGKLATCRKCHVDAPPAFASFMPHVDPGDRAQAPLLYWTRLGLKGLVALLAAFFCFHTLAWLVRARRERAAAPAAGPLVRRHGSMVRLLHGVGIIAFLALGASGAVMAFNEQPWAAAAIRVAGGMHAVGLVHRVAGAAALATFALHLAWAARSALERRRRGSKLLGPDSIVPRLSDARDLAAHVRWFAGRGPRPAWNRFAYWEKLQYWAVAGIIVLSGLTGLLLWFPTLASRHLPGALLNLAAVLHSVEALLAAAIVIAAHVAHALLRRGSAPLDQGMFTGVAAEEDYRRERAPEWARIEAEGRAEGLRCSPPARWRAAALTAFGVLASAGSIALLALAVYGLLST